MEQLPIPLGDRLRVPAGGEGLRGRDPGRRGEEAACAQDATLGLQSLLQRPSQGEPQMLCLHFFLTIWDKPVESQDFGGDFVAPNLMPFSNFRATPASTQSSC